MFEDIDSWRIADPNEGVALADIREVSSRARSLFVRNRSKPSIKAGFQNLHGAIDMMAGLDYHGAASARICQALARGEGCEEALHHEAVAYINRAGQFHSFARSRFVRTYVTSPLEFIPTICRVKIFRDKHTAHRSMDAPHGESDVEHWRHAASLGTLSPRISTPRPGKEFELPTSGTVDLADLWQKHWEAHYWTINTYDGQAKQQVNFTLEKEHPALIGEAYSLLEAIVAAKDPI